MDFSTKNLKLPSSERSAWPSLCRLPGLDTNAIFYSSHFLPDLTVSFSNIPNIETTGVSPKNILSSDECFPKMTAFPREIWSVIIPDASHFQRYFQKTVSGSEDVQTGYESSGAQDYKPIRGLKPRYTMAINKAIQCSLDIATGRRQEG